ncbi:MAG: hypothetical protein IT384_19740 [Deltaproteobacteria bacterium]|nr:hypothetical protein [Deltaproteobacteria bacterium]
MLSSALLLAASLISDASYASARDQAQTVKNLGRFLEEYLGDCLSDDPSFDRRSCESKAQGVQKERQGRLMRIELEDVTEQIQFAGWDERRGAFVLHFTPFFSERGLALSQGKPTTLNKDGLPVVKNLPLWVKLPKDEPEFGFRRQLERGNVRLELVFRPGKPWAFPPKQRGDAPVRGVAMELVGVRLYSGRSDRVITEQTY